MYSSELSFAVPDARERQGKCEGNFTEGTALTGAERAIGHGVVCV